jgi:hypothetical protein
LTVLASVAPWELVLIVATLAAVQSVFGVGLLVCGTPVLLMLGVEFPVILGYLLPCSIVVSLLQVTTSGGFHLEPIRKQFLVFTAPAVVLATAAAVFLGSPDQIGLAVGVMLLVTALLRLVSPGGGVVSAFVGRYRPALLVLLGVIHGLSNLGGGVLTAIVSSSFPDKDSVRRHIAFCYGLMASLQLLVVVLKGLDVRVALFVALPLLAAAVYLAVGQWIFVKVRRGAYQHALTSLLATFGVLLVTR